MFTLFGIFKKGTRLSQGDALSSLLFNFDLEYAIRRVQGNKIGLELNGKHEGSYLCCWHQYNKRKFKKPLRKIQK